MLKEAIVMLYISILPDVTLHENVLPIIKDLRGVYEGQITITRNLSTISRNRAVGGLKTSYHICGKAIDIRIWGLSRKNILDILRLKEYNYDVVVESDHIHIEMQEGC